MSEFYLVKVALDNGLFMVQSAHDSEEGALKVVKDLNDEAGWNVAHHERHERGMDALHAAREAMEWSEDTALIADESRLWFFAKAQAYAAIAQAEAAREQVEATRAQTAVLERIADALGPPWTDKPAPPEGRERGRA